MLLDRASATQSFSDLDASEESYSPAVTGGRALPDAANRPKRDVARRPGEILPGDEVVFARLDVAEALGIWRHATGRVVETHAEGRAGPSGAVTVDVKFEGHETLHRYLPDLFEKRVG